MTTQPYHLADRGQSLGTWEYSAVLAGLATGRLSPEVLSWREGEPGWLPLRQRPECASGVSAGVSLQAPPPVMPWEAAVGSWTTWPRPGDFWRTAKAVLFSPEATFTAKSADGWQGPLRWLLWSSVAAIVVGFPLWSLLLSLRPLLLAPFGVQESGAAAIFNLTYFLRALVVYPTAVVCMTIATTAIVHGLLRLFGGGLAGWRRTFRTLAYVVGALCFVAAVPVVACAVPLWGFILAFLALGHAHREPAWRGFFALGLVFGCGSCAGLLGAAWSFSRNFMR